MLHNRSHDIMKVMVKDDVIAVPPMEENEVLLSYLSPVWQLSDKVNVALLGEMDKFVPISPERIKALDFHKPGVGTYSIVSNPKLCHICEIGLGW